MDHSSVPVGSETSRRDDVFAVADSVFDRNARLRERLRRKIRESAPPSDSDPPVHVVVTAAEINDQHGTGPLVKRVFQGRPGIFSIRLRDQWGTHDFGDWQARLPFVPSTLGESLREARRLLEGKNVKSVTCVPFTGGELLTALAIKDAFDAKLCVWIMDDQNIAVNAISDRVMKKCLEESSIRLTTHPELRDAYQDKYGLATYILPAVVPSHLVNAFPGHGTWDGRTTNVALLGSFWDQSWFDRLCSALESCDCSTDWYGQNKSPWLRFPLDDLSRARIRPFGVVPEERLALELSKYPLVIVPAGALDGQESNPAVAALSLPGRIIFAAATSHVPILVVGSEQTCAARFVRHFGVGSVSPYEAEALSAAIAHCRTPAVAGSAVHPATGTATRA